jgi:hypothetical protein
MPEIVSKKPSDELDYGFQWRKWLFTGELIISSVWTVPAGITRISDSITGTVTSVWLSGGTDGETYNLVNRIVTNQGRDKTLCLAVKVTSCPIL